MVGSYPKNKCHQASIVPTMVLKDLGTLWWPESRLLIVLTAGILCCPEVVSAQVSGIDTELQNRRTDHETVEQAKQLRSLACKYAQGYFFSKPINNASVEAILRSGVRGADFISHMKGAFNGTPIKK